MKYRQNWVCGVAVEKVRYEREVAGSKPTGRNVHKNSCDLRLWWNGQVADRWGLPRIKIFLFPIFKISFLKNSLPCVFWHSANSFTMCPINGTRQKTSLPTPICRVQFAVCNTWQRLCRVQKGLCRVFLAHGKQPASRSDCNWRC